MRYFRYISQSKVEMLYPQVTERASRGFEFEPVLRLPFFEFKAKRAREQEAQPMVRKLDRVVASLNEQSEVKDLTKSGPLEVEGWYRDKGLWHEGIVVIQTEPVFGVSKAAAAYICWRTLRENTLVILAGSPANVIGEKLASEHLMILGTREATDLLMFLCNDLFGSGEGSSIAMISESDKGPHSPADVVTPRDLIARRPPPISLLAQGFTFLGTDSRPDQLGAAIGGVLCFGYLQKLPERKLEVLFRSYSKHKYEPEEIDTRLSLFLWSKGKRGGKEVDHAKISPRRFSVVVIGSPLFVAQ